MHELPARKAAKVDSLCVYFGGSISLRARPSIRRAAVLRVELAYIDPGSGSYLFQILIASLLAVGVSVKVFWKRIRSLARSVLSRRGR